MPWLRLTIVTPLPGARREAHQLLNDLASSLAKEKGFVLGGVIAESGTSGELGRFGIWEHREDADRASNLQHIMAVRSQLHNLIEPGHRENLFEITEVSHNIPGGQ